MSDKNTSKPINAMKEKIKRKRSLYGLEKPIRIRLAKLKIPISPNAHDISKNVGSNKLSKKQNKQRIMPAKFGIPCGPKPLINKKENIEIILRYFIDNEFVAQIYVIENILLLTKVKKLFLLSNPA